MGRIKGRGMIKEYIKKYSGNSVDFFQLKNDGDTAKVRFLHGDDEDLEIALVHRVEIDEKERWVECLEEECPLCEVSRPQLKLFLFLYDYTDDKVKVWERGTSMTDFIIGFIDKYGPLNNRDYEIVRHGKKGDNKTTYQLFPEDKGPFKMKEEVDGKIVEKEAELPKRPDLYGRFVLQMDLEEMKGLALAEKPQERSRERGTGGRREPGF